MNLPRRQRTRIRGVSLGDGGNAYPGNAVRSFGLVRMTKRKCEKRKKNINFTTRVLHFVLWTVYPRMLAMVALYAIIVIFSASWKNIS